MPMHVAFRVLISHQEKSFKLDSAIRVEKVTPRSSAIEGAPSGAGAWFAVEGAGGRVLYCRGIDNPFDGQEVFTGEKHEMRRVQIPGLRQGLSLLVPQTEGAETLAIYASEPPNRDGKQEPAKRLFQVSMRDLAAMAEKGGTGHGR
jgi:hypothetical protein